MEEYLHRLNRIAQVLNLEAKSQRILELEALTSNPNLWQNQEEAVSLTTELQNLKNQTDQYQTIKEYLDMGNGLSSADFETIDQELKTLEEKALLSGEYDQNNAILTVHAGTGGVEAQDWALMLERMYLRFVEQGSTESDEERILAINRNNWKAAIVEENQGEEAGVKKVVLEIQGTYAFGLLKSEAGVHRLVRLSPFNAKNLRQTSFALVEVIPEVTQSTKVNIDPNELKIDVFRAGGHGGQSVNTTDSAVRLTHTPSGITVTVQNERSQHQNKATAMKILESRLTILQELKNSQETAMLKGEVKEGSWGNQIRSYVLQPYQMVKDHRTEYETSNTQAVLNGQIHGFITAYLSKQ